MTVSWRQDRASQSVSWFSAGTDRASRRPSDENSTFAKWPAWRSKTAVSGAAIASQILAVPSRLPVASVRPSGAKLTLKMREVWPLKAVT